MLQWITALEKAADACQFVTKNRFGSFAPIRMNVAAQWLVDGVSLLLCLFIFTDCIFSTARLHVEFVESAHDGEREHIYPQLVALTWYGWSIGGSCPLTHLLQNYSCDDRAKTSIDWIGFWSEKRAKASKFI
jgi:hypothetical protein